MITNLTDATFDVCMSTAQVPVLVGFWASWCMPCLAMNPLLEEIAEKWDGQLLVAKVNVDENTDISRRYGVLSLPTLMIFEFGMVEKQLTAPKRVELLTAIGEVLA